MLVAEKGAGVGGLRRGRGAEAFWGPVAVAGETSRFPQTLPLVRFADKSLRDFRASGFRSCTRDVRRARGRFYTSGMERKLATVLFVDIVDSTSIVAASDPEVVRRRVNRFFEMVSHCVTLHGGIVEKFAGDAVLAAFGVPQAHEDDAQRATRAALAMRESIGELGLEARIGIEAGEGVVEDSDSTFVTGEAVNLAARLQQVARPGEILVGPTAHRLAAGALVVEDTGPLEIKGVNGPFRAWRVIEA